LPKQALYNFARCRTEEENQADRSQQRGWLQPRRGQNAVSVKQESQTSQIATKFALRHSHIAAIAEADVCRILCRSRGNPQAAKISRCPVQMKLALFAHAGAQLQPFL
jgi:hypothetical protein